MDYSFDLSVRDVFESEVQTEMDQILRSGSVAYDSQTDTIDLTGYSPDENGDLMGDFSTDMTDAALQDGNIWLTENMGALPTPAAAVSTADITHFSSPEKYALDGQGLLVDPQTGQPVSSLNLILGVSNEQQQQILLQQAPHQQLDRHDRSLENLTAGDLESSNPLNVSTSQQQQYLAFTPQQLQQSGLISGHFQTVPVLELQQQPRQHQQQQTNPTPTHTHQSQAATLLSKHHKLEPVAGMEQKVYPKPAYSYSCLITMAMKNSKTGCMPVSDIYHFMCENFPYFKTAPDGWKNSVRHNLSLNKCFAKIEKPATANGSSRKGCLWALNPAKAAKMAEEVHKWTKKDPVGIRRSMAKPEDLERIEERVRQNHVHPILNAKTTKSSTADIKTVVVKTVSATRTTPLCTATTTMTTVPAVNPKSHVLDPVPISLYQAVDNGVFNGDINIVDPSLTSLDGDLSLPDHFMDPLNCEFMNLDVPITISPLPNNNNPMFGGLLEMSPVKDNQSLTTMGETTPCQYLQFCSPGRTPVTAFM